MMKPILVGAAAAAVALSGCTLAPAYHRPAAPIPQAWPTGPSYAAPQPGPAAGQVSWRSFFADRNLQAVISTALTQNRNLRIAISNIEAAQAQYHVQRSELLPTVNATGGMTESHGRSAAAGQVGTTRIYSASIGFSAWEIDLFGRIRSLSRAALEQYLATEEARRDVQTSLISQVASQYFTLAADEELLKTAQETFEAQNSSLTLTRARFAGGIASMIDVRQAEETVEGSRADVARYTTQVAQDKNALNLLVGAPVPETLLPKALPAANTIMVDLPEGTSSLVLLQRPDVQQAEHQLRAANADIGAARAAFFPTISLAAAAGVVSPALGALFQGENRSWSFSPNLALPIFTGGRNLGNLRYTQAQRDIAVSRYEQSIQTAFREVADALARRGTIGEQLAAEQALVNSANDGLRLETARYQRGVDTYLNVLVAQHTLYTAQQALISTQLTELTNAVSLYRSLGGGVS